MFETYNNNTYIYKGMSISIYCMLCVYVATDRHGLDGSHDGKLLFGTARMIPHYWKLSK